MTTGTPTLRQEMRAHVTVSGGQMRARQQWNVDWDQIFVLGAERSGTTVLHALLCTSDEVNPYVAECTYFSHLLRAFPPVWQYFDVHAHSYFGARSEFLEYHSNLLRMVLADTWRHLGCPRVMALKDPLLTRQVGVLAMLLPGSRFVVSVRDAAMSSRRVSSCTVERVGARPTTKSFVGSVRSTTPITWRSNACRRDIRTRWSSFHMKPS